VLDEKQIYRIDHYLGKETVQNVLVFRFANAIFEPIWNRNYVDHVQITVAEDVGVGHRAPYYERAGVLRDMFQNHLLQLLCLVAMEPPASFSADMLRNEKVKVLSAIRPVDLDDTVRAQYEGYRGHEDVAPNSETPTYAAMKLYLDNWRWKGVPFYLRSGKALKMRTSGIGVHFQSPPHVMFNLPPGQKLSPNMFSLCIQPEEAIQLKFEAKVPGSGQDSKSVNMDFSYHEAFPGEVLPDAYERLLLDALKGEASLFMRSDEIETAWRIVDPVISGWETAGKPPLCFYKPGSWGPEEADLFMAKRERAWSLGCLQESQ
jgi:glucose-6-phosphate 1-dehydrogenase